MGKLTAAIAVAALAVSGVAAAATGDVQTRTVKADPDGALAFNRTALSARRGKIKLVFRNPSGSGLPHGIAIKGRKSRIVGPGHSASVTVRLPKGTYTYYCPVPGHRSAGMKGKLFVK